VRKTNKREKMGVRKRRGCRQRENTRICTRQSSTLQSVFAVQQAVLALDALERIVGRALLIATKVVLVGLFVLELVNVSPDNDTDVWRRGDMR